MRVWSAAYDLVATFSNPVSARGEVPFAYRVDSTSDGLLFASSEDAVVRVIDTAAGAVVQSIQHPSVCWGATEIPGTGGDVITVCQHPATSRKGHVYHWTRDPARKADEPVLAQFVQDAIVPKSKAAESGGSGGGSSSSSSSGGLGGLPIKGNYDGRAAVAGTHEGEQAFFKRKDGSIMMCSWSNAAGAWTDIGAVQGAGDDGPWDVVRTVTLDLEGGGLKTMDLKFNLDGERAAGWRAMPAGRQQPTVKACTCLAPAALPAACLPAHLA